MMLGIAVLPSFAFPFGLFGRRRPQQPKFADVLPVDDEPSELGSEDFDYDDDDEETTSADEPRTMHFANPGFGESMLEEAEASGDLSSLIRRTNKTKRLSSVVARHKRSYTNEFTDIEVDVALAPNPFAFHLVPHGDKSFCSRDDSEICVNTADAMSSMGLSPAGTPDVQDHVNALYLTESFSFSRDDMEIGKYTPNKRVPLRHMGSALSYRLQMTGAEGSMFGDESSMTSPVPSFGWESSMDLPEIRQSFKERNRMVRLESVVGRRRHSRGNSLTEFGVVDARSADILTGPRPQSAFSRCAPPASPLPVPGTLKSYPISFLSKVDEEKDCEVSGTDDESECADVGECKKEEKCACLPEEESPMKSPPTVSIPADPSRKLMKTVSSRKSKHARSGSMTSFKIRIQLTEMEQNGFSNPFYEQDFSSFSPKSESNTSDAESGPAQRKLLPRIESFKKTRRSSAATSQDGDSSEPSRKGKPSKLQKSDSMRMALLERYLAQSVVTDFLTAPSNQ